MSIDKLCECGHPESKHDVNFSLGVCFACYNSKGEDRCMCIFKMDNLRYLEDLSVNNKSL